MSIDKKLLLVDLWNQLNIKDIQDFSLFLENNFNLKEIVHINFRPIWFSKIKTNNNIPYNIVYLQEIIKNFEFYKKNTIKLKKSI